ncbi:unnamed protein product [Mytilus edulis]|uniref:Uncharacterized protein n=1 Tax=Mytilus edulis TaxID=6550 RepID=A0A8S3UMR0_MYTED|nr:unnamed protein product [Mytilus edulis]
MTVLLESHSYELYCPKYQQRKIRSIAHCNGSDRYLCLFDDNTKHNRESCRSTPEFEIPGYKFIIVGTLQGVPCASNRYQPIRFWTNENSECVFKTSKCNSIGQLMYKKGTSTEDIACRCDYTTGYDFVIKPKNPCMCSPEKEDCECYFKNVPSDRFLLQNNSNVGLRPSQIALQMTYRICYTFYFIDYDCVPPTTQWNSSFKCQLKDSVGIIEDQIPIVTIDESSATTTGR